MTSSGHQHTFQRRDTSYTTSAALSFYECQCGKRYDAFPALYLHFKRKHHKKISSNPSPRIIRIRTTPYCKVITYLHTQAGISQKNSNLKIDENFQKKVKIVFDDFAKSSEFEELDKDLAYHAIENFYSYILGMIKEGQGEIEGEFYEQLPLLFNEFYRHQFGSEAMSKHYLHSWTEIIIRLGNWLKKKGYTDLTVMKNEKFNIQGQEN